MKLGRTIIFLLTAAMTAVSCSTTRVLQEGEYRLARNKIEVSGEKNFNAGKLEPYIKQKANTPIW